MTSQTRKHMIDVLGWGFIVGFILVIGYGIWLFASAVANAWSEF